MHARLPFAVAFATALMASAAGAYAHPHHATTQPSDDGFQRMTGLPDSTPDPAPIPVQPVEPLYAAQPVQPSDSGLVLAPPGTMPKPVVTPPVVLAPVTPAPGLVIAPPGSRAVPVVAVAAPAPGVAAPIVAAPAAVVATPVVAPARVVPVVPVVSPVLPVPVVVEGHVKGGAGRAHAMVQDGVPTTWVIHRGHTVQDVLGEWAKLAGWTLVWKSNYQYQIAAGAELSDATFEDAASTLISAYANASPPLDLRIFPKNKTLVVRTPSDTDIN